MSIRLGGLMAKTTRATFGGVECEIKSHYIVQNNPDHPGPAGATSAAFRLNGDPVTDNDRPLEREGRTEDEAEARVIARLEQLLGARS